MTVRSETRVVMAASQEEIHGYLSDASRWPEWAAGILSCQVSGGGALVAGSRLEQQVRKPVGSPASRTLDVTSVDAPRQLGFAGSMGPTSITWGFDLRVVDDDKTEVLLWIEADRGGIMRLIPPGVLRTMFRGINRRELDAIRAAVEPLPSSSA